MIVVSLLTFLAVAGAEPAPVDPSANRWAEPTRGILAMQCGSCHIPNLRTSVPRALAVFDLTDEPWYGRLTPDQFDNLLARVRGIKGLPKSDESIVENFVRWAHDHSCPPGEP